ncbi:PD-(D/E)XK nuclease family protein [Priestia megaterium]
MTTSAKIELNMDDIYTYLQCPMKYKLTKVHEIPSEDNYKSAVLYSKGIHQTISYFYHEVMQGKLPTLRQMRDKWASYYYSIFEEDKKTKENFLQARTGTDHQRTSQILNRGMEAIYAFYAENKDNPGVPIAVNYPFRVAIFDDLILTGEFELIRERPDENNRRFVEIVDFKTSKNKTDASSSFFLRHDLRATAMSFAFQELFNSTPDRFIFDYIGTDTQLSLYRDENEIKRLKSVLKGVRNGIKQEDFYPRQSFMCKNCPMMNYCDRLQF